MIICPKRLLLLPLLTLTMIVATTATVRAQDRAYPRPGGASATLQVHFGTAPHWTGIGNLSVEELPATERPDYDVFRYGGTYYAYDNARWYSSTRADGDFTMIEDRDVPGDFSRIPREHWRNYPQAWQDRPDQGSGGMLASLHVSFGGARRWMGISGTHVQELPTAERPDYDLFRYGGTYYAHDSDRWYASTNETGDYAAIDASLVPAEFSSIPREHWRNYPQGWQNRQNDASLQVSFDHKPRWSGVRGTNVRSIRGPQRPDYDMFRYDGSYYAYSNSRWYSSRRSDGTFNAIDDRQVPRELNRVPRGQWRNYPSGWSDESGTPRPDQGEHRLYGR